MKRRELKKSFSCYRCYRGDTVRSIEPLIRCSHVSCLGRFCRYLWEIFPLSHCCSQPTSAQPQAHIYIPSNPQIHKLPENDPPLQQHHHLYAYDQFDSDTRPKAPQINLSNHDQSVFAACPRHVLNRIRRRTRLLTMARPNPKRQSRTSRVHARSR